MINKIFSSPKKLLMILLICTSVVLVAGVVLVAVLGFNKSYQFGGTYELSVDYLDNEKTNENLNTISAVLDDNKCTFSADILDKSYASTIIVKFGASSKKVDTIKSQLTEKLVDVQNLQINAVNTTSFSKTIKNLMIMSVVVFVCVVLYGIIRKSWIYGISLGTAFVGTIFTALSLFGFTRVELSSTSLYMLLAFALLAVVLSVYYISTALARKDGIGGEKVALKEHYSNAVGASVFSLGIPAIVFVLLMIGLIFTFNFKFTMVGLSGIISVVSCVWSGLFLAGSLYIVLEDAIASKIKRVMSRNNNRVKDNKKTEDGIV